MRISFSNQPNETSIVQMKPGEGIIINHNGNAEHGISVVLSKDGKEFIISSPFNALNKVHKIKAK